MRRFWDRIFGLNYERSIWVEEEELGVEKILCHKNKRYAIKIPQSIEYEKTLRLVGLGKAKSNKTGDLILHIWLNKGEDIRKNLWLPETAARKGIHKNLLLDEKQIAMAIPPNSTDGLTIRLKGLGRPLSYNPHAPALHQRKVGDLLVKLRVYPDRITPNYQSFDTLSTENMELEGWVYRKFDEVTRKLNRSSLPIHSILADEITDLFNDGRWKSIFQTLVSHLQLGHLSIEFTNSPSITLPGICEKTATFQNNTIVRIHYKITINDQFLDNPFCIAAILAHELCHVIYSEKIDSSFSSTGYVLKTEEATLEEERTVDLLVFMFKMGEFQLRVARDKRLTLGYFNQEIFERIQVIVSRKLNSI